MPGVTIAKSGAAALRGSARSPAARRRRRRARPAAPGPRAAGPDRARRPRTPVSRERVAVHAGQHGDGDDERRRPPEPGRGVVRRVSRRLHHPRAPRRVHVHHPHAERRRRRDRGRDGVGDVVKLEVEEHAVAALDDRRTTSGPSAVKSRLPILKPPADAAQRRGQRQRVARRFARRARSGADPRLFLLRRVEAAGQVGEPRDVVPAHVVARGRRAASSR